MYRDLSVSGRETVIQVSDYYRDAVSRCSRECGIGGEVLGDGPGGAFHALGGGEEALGGNPKPSDHPSKRRQIRHAPLLDASEGCNWHPGVLRSLAKAHAKLGTTGGDKWSELLKWVWHGLLAA